MEQPLGDYVLRLRTTAGIGVSETARRVGCPAAYISLLERGQREAAIPVLYLLVKALRGDVRHALFLMGLDAGVPAEAWAAAAPTPL